MEPLYKPKGVEERWQRTWEEEGLYNAEPDDPRETFVICLPPPNVTDRLHMGHALNASCQDVLIRFHRMRGFITLATVRPATILADVAVAVHPSDERYRDAVGRDVIVPFVERRVPVIADERVDAGF